LQSTHPEVPGDESELGNLKSHWPGVFLKLVLNEQISLDRLSNI
jgi:hypothetical protein